MVRVRALESWQDPRGGEIDRVSIDNGTIALEVLSLGGIIRNLWVPDREGERRSIVLGCDSAEDYLAQDAHLGAVAGRFANRIANGRISDRQHEYQLDVNHFTHCLHGGSEGFNRKNWQMGSLPDGVRLTLSSPDGDMGFPGTCQVQIDYRLTGNNLFIEAQATTDKACPINLTQHSYFNLDGSRQILEHELQVGCRGYLVTDEQGIPESVADVSQTVLDFSTSKMLARAVLSEEVSGTQGLDHCYVMPRNDGRQLHRFGRLISRESGRSLTLYTNQPGVQVYTANFLQSATGRKGEAMAQYQGICLEPQLLPDSPNQPELLGNGWTRADEVYHHISRYQFDIVS